ncbi:MAG TPA: hypothetical protein VEW90_06485 [Gaiellaceae bacterium]|nr:hypothetical protein [Gaiellaceae bacterium]
MERFNALGRGAQIMLISSVLLLIISFFNWQEVEFDLGPLGEGSAGVSAWDDFLGILMGVLTIVLIARIVANLAAVDIPIPVSFAMTSAVLAFLIFAFALIKNLTDDYSTWASYVGVVLAALIAVGAWMEIQAAGGVDTLRSEATSYGGSGATTATAAPPAAAEAYGTPPPAPAETAPAAEAAAPSDPPPPIETAVPDATAPEAAPSDSADDGTHATDDDTPGGPRP